MRPLRHLHFLGPTQKRMSEGTPLDILESGGDIDNAADAERMAQLMRDVNASGGLSDSPQTMNMPRVSAPPMRNMAPVHQPPPPPQYTPMEEEYRPRKKNIWGSITEKLRDPLIVSVIVFVLSLPVLHTMLAKYAGWAFAVGGQLSWIGLVAMSLLAGVTFGIAQGTASLLGL
jgi:hypothetical protein